MKSYSNEPDLICHCLSEVKENKTYSWNPSFTYHSLWSILQTWQETKANPGSPVLYTVALEATFENMNSTVCAIWAAPGSKGKNKLGSK